VTHHRGGPAAAVARLREAMSPGSYWAWRAGGVTAVTTSNFMRILGGVARKD
jgi:hypothetical protein